MRITVAVLLLAMVSAAQAQEVWRQVDAQGVVRYTDRPAPGAVRVDLPQPGRWAGRSVRSSPPAPLENRSAAERREPPGTLVITRPAPDETVWGAGGELEVTLAMDDLPETEGRLVLELDGAEAVWQGAPPALRLMEVWRGEHRLRAILLDSRGKSLASSEPVRFFKREPKALGKAAGVP